MASFSVVVPTFRRPDRLRACLTALAELDHPDYEVIVVDDGSPEPIEPVAAPFGDRMALTVHRQPNTGPAAARNVGVRRARGTYLAFTDDDCAPRPAWLRGLDATLTEHPDAMVGGVTVNAVAGNPFSAASQDLVSYIYEYYRDRGRGGFLASNNMAVPAEAFRSMGGFDTSYPRPGGEDRELCDRWVREGGEIWHAPDAVLDHHHHLDARSFWRQHVTYGRGAYHFHAQRARAAGEPVRVEPARFYLDLLRYPFRERSGGEAAGVSALLAVSQVANATGYLAERWRTRG